MERTVILNYIFSTSLLLEQLYYETRMNHYIENKFLKVVQNGVFKPLQSIVQHFCIKPDKQILIIILSIFRDLT
jgi:hypothetical protein